MKEVTIEFGIMKLKDKDETKLKKLYTEFQAKLKKELDLKDKDLVSIYRMYDNDYSELITYLNKNNSTSCTVSG